MRTRFWRQRTKIISATLTLIASLLLTGCLGNDEEDWNGKNISGLMPELEFDLINSQGELVSGSDYSGRVRMLFFGFTSCPDVCPTALQKLNQATSGLDPKLQDEVLTLFVSVDPNRDTPERLAKAVGRPDMLEDPRFNTNIARSANLVPLGEIMSEAMLTDTRANWEKRLAEADVAFALDPARDPRLFSRRLLPDYQTRREVNL